MSDTQRDEMRDFMGKVAAQALDWDRTVDMVTIRLETESSFESNGYSGILWIRMFGNKLWGHEFSATDFRYSRNRDALIAVCREIFLRDLMKEAQP